MSFYDRPQICFIFDLTKILPYLWTWKRQTAATLFFSLGAVKKKVQQNFLS